MRLVATDTKRPRCETTASLTEFTSDNRYLLNNPGGQLGPVSDRARRGSVRRPATAGKAPEN